MKSFAIFLVLISSLLTSSCNYYCRMWGDNTLGSNFTLMEGDRLRDRTIIYCTGTSGGCGCCQVGLPIIPSNTSPYNGKIYIASALDYPHWIVAKAVHQDKTVSYWLLDKALSNKLAASTGAFENSIQAHVIGPLTLVAFQKKARQLSIPADFK